MINQAKLNGVLLDEPTWEDCPPVQELDLPHEEPLEQCEDSYQEATAVQREAPVPEPTAIEAPKISQAEAMRQALGDLGLEAKNTDLAHYLRSKFGIEPKNIAVLKSAAKKALLQKQSGPEEAVPAIELPQPQEAVQSEVPTLVSKESVVEKAESVPAAAEPRNGILPDSNRVILIQESQNTQIESRLNESDGQVAQATATFSIDDVQVVKQLCDRLGTDTVLELVDLLVS